jgi:AraC-like DNA-binding protein
MERPVTCYREYAPHPLLEGRIRALFSFGPARPEPLLAYRIIREVSFGAGAAYSATFADGDGSIVIELGRLGQADGSWHEAEPRAGAIVMGAMSRAGRSHGPDLPEMVGAYFQPAQAPAFTRVPGRVLADRSVALEELWGGNARDLPARLREVDLAASLELVEATLLRRLAAPRGATAPLDLARLLGWIRSEGGQLSVERLAQEAGVSRQHLTRVFREWVGVSPKRYCRITRFQAALGHLAGGAPVNWARLAARCGYTDQSHLIAEFRELSSLTPHQLVSERRFHPFIERARVVRPAPPYAGRNV